MDYKVLADALTTILAPALPRLMGHSIGDLSSATSDVGRVKLVWSRLRDKVEGKPAASEAAQEVAKSPEDPDAQAALRFQLRKLLEGDSVLASEVASLLDSDSTRYAAVLHGSGAIAQGYGAVAAGAGGIAVGRSVHAKSRD